MEKLYEKFEKFLSQNPNLDADYKDILSDSDLTIENMVDELENFLQHCEVHYQFEMPGDLREFARFILSHSF